MKAVKNRSPSSTINTATTDDGTYNRIVHVLIYVIFSILHQITLAGLLFKLFMGKM